MEPCINPHSCCDTKAVNDGDPINVNNHPWVFPSHRFCALPERGRPENGSTISIQFFKEIGINENASLWIGKGENLIDKSLKNTKDRSGRHGQAFLEVLAGKLYRLAGIEIPDMGLCLQPMSKQSQEEYRQWDVHFGGETFPQVFSRFVEDFQPLGNDFIENYRVCAKAGANQYTLQSATGPLRLEGFGQFLAVAEWLYDIDCIGFGFNLGWVQRYDSVQGPCAHILKIDPGAAFNFLPGSMFNQYLEDGDAASRCIWVGMCYERPLKFDELMPHDRTAFVEQAKRLLSISFDEISELAHLTFLPEALPLKLVRDLIRGLDQRRRRLVAAFAPELYRKLQVTATHKRAEQVLKGRVDTSDLVAIADLRAQVATLRLQELQNETESWTFQLPERGQFVGRDRILLELEATFAKQAEAKYLGLYGLGGTGKTQIALDYAHAHLNAYKRILWFYAEHALSLESQFRSLAQLICPQVDRNLSFEALKDRLYACLQTERVLIIFDNVESLEAIQVVLPSPSELKKGWNFLLTFRHPTEVTLPGLISFKVSAFTLDEGRAYVRLKLGEQSPEEAIDALLETVAFHPLALSHAVVYIRQGHAPLAEYPQFFFSHQLREHTLSDDDIMDTIRTSFWLSLRHLEAHHLDAFFLLKSCAGLSSSAIPSDLLEDITHSALTSLPEQLALLAQYAIIKLESRRIVADVPKEETYIHIHPLLVTLLLEDCFPTTLPLRAVALPPKLQPTDYPSDVFKHPSPYPAIILQDERISLGICKDNSWQFTPFPPECEQLFVNLPFSQEGTIFHVSMLSPEQKEYLCQLCPLTSPLEQHLKILVNAIAKGLRYDLISLDGIQRAKQLTHHALVLSDHLPSSLLSHKAELLRLLGQHLLYGMEEYSLAHKCLAQMLAVNESLYDPNHPVIASSLVDLGNACGRLGNYDKQKELLERGLAIQEVAFGPDHLNVANTLASLSNLFYTLGEYSQQKTMLERALQIQTPLLGPDSPQLLTTLSNLAAALTNLGDYNRASSLLEQALHIQEKSFGVNHPGAANILASLADLSLCSQRKKELLERSLLIRQAHLGPEHPSMIIALMKLGNAYGDLGDHGQQKHFLEQALVLSKKYHGENHFETAAVLANLSNAYGNLGDYEVQKTCLEQALPVLQSHFGPDHPHVANTITNLANSFGSLGNPKKQKKLLEKSLLIIKNYYGDNHLQEAIIFTNLGNALGALGSFEEQKKAFEHALRIKEDHYGPNHQEVFLTLAGLAGALNNLGHWAQAKKLFKKVMKWDEKFYGPDHPEVANDLINLSDIVCNLGDYEQSRVLIERALRISLTHYDSNHLNIAAIFTVYSNILAALGDFHQAKEYAERGLRIHECCYGPDHPAVASSLSLLSSIILELGHIDQAKEFLERALQIQESDDGDCNVQLVEILLPLADTYLALNSLEQAKYNAERALAILQQNYEPEHHYVADALCCLGEILGKLDPILAKKHLEHALAIHEKHLGVDHPEVATACFHLATVELTLQEFELSFIHAKRCYSIRLRVLGEHHDWTQRAFKLLEAIEDQKNNN